MIRLSYQSSPRPQPKAAVYDNAKPVGNLRFDFETGPFDPTFQVTAPTEHRTAG